MKKIYRLTPEEVRRACSTFVAKKLERAGEDIFPCSFNVEMVKDDGEIIAEVQIVSRSRD